MILKDFKKFIPGWPEKKETHLTLEKCLQPTVRLVSNKGFNYALDFIENLEFNPTKMIELDENKPIWKAYRCLYCGEYFCEKCAEKHFGETKEEHKLKKITNNLVR